MSCSIVSTAWGYQPKGYGFICGIKGGRFSPHAIDTHGSGLSTAVRLAVKELFDGGQDVYWTPQTFSVPRRLKEHALQGRLLYADLDAAPLDKLPIEPSVLWQSSKGRHQALWLLTKQLEPHDLELMNRRMTYSAGADRHCWDLAHLMRVPGTLNYKRETPEEVRLLWERWEI